MSFFCWKNSNENCEDLFRHTIIRFAGYYHEVGQHLNNIWNLPLFLSGFSASYVFSDLLDKCRKASISAEKVVRSQNHLISSNILYSKLYFFENPNKTSKKKEPETNEDQKFGKKLAIEASDVLIWHCLATIILPHLIVGGAQRATRRLLCRVWQDFQYKNTISSIIGLLTIPFISRLIDHMTTEFMEFTYRPLFR